jgi:predicted ATP-grasp superfamily ATP-dependent carboligase
MTPRQKTDSRRLLILASKLGYQTRGFAEAAEKLGVEVVFGTDRCHQLEDPWADGALPLHFEEPEEAAELILHRAHKSPIHAILALGDRPMLTAAHAAPAIGLTYNSVESVEVSRDKLRQREVLRAARLPVPEFFSFRLSEDPRLVAGRVTYPCVVKPLRLSASQGVIRANDKAEFVAAVERVHRLLESPEVQVLREPGQNRLLVERFIPGREVAVEALLTHGRLRVLAIFDKPDPLEGPYFEETIYVTPSRLPREVQSKIENCLTRVVGAIGLTHGPLHAEFRVNEAGPWVLEVQPRPIGGLCSRALRFGPLAAPVGEGMIYLEELLVRHALGLEGSGLPREAPASGVMMIPVPQSGVLDNVEGVEDAQRTPLVEEIQITARLHDYIAAWPEGSSYLGFIFARGESPEEVEAALRESHVKLRFVLTPRLPVEHPVTGRVSQS